MTLYTFDKDAANSGKSVCNGRCATMPAPVMVESGATASGAWSIVTRDDGAKQWAYKGMPVYLYRARRQARRQDRRRQGRRLARHQALIAY